MASCSLIAVIVLALVFDFLNGIHDSSNVVATMISSRALPPRVALGMTAVAEFLGPFIFGVAVANTIGNDVVNSEAISLQVLLAALVSAIFWNLFTWYMGFPSSSSHAMIGGLVGAVVMGAGWQAINMDGSEEDLDRPVHLPFYRVYLWFSHPTVDLFALLECHTAHQRLVQTRPDIYGS